MLSFAHVHARAYADQVRDNDRAELVAAWDHLETRGRNAAQDFKVPFCDNLDQLLELDIDAVMVNAETNLHPQVIVAAAQAGADCVVLCDTNGGSLPGRVEATVRAVVDHLDRLLLARTSRCKQVDAKRPQLAHR